LVGTDSTNYSLEEQRQRLDKALSKKSSSAEGEVK
jgi:hypothetical protein